MEVTATPAEVGFDAAALARIDDHFQRYVDDGRLAGWQLVVARHGEIAHVSHVRAGATSRPALPVERDTIWRIYSMTKPITSVAAMMLWEEGRFELTDPISRWLPEFADVRVFTGRLGAQPCTVPAAEPIRMWHLLTHTAGLTYGFHAASPGRRDLPGAPASSSARPPGTDLAGACDGWARLPLLFQPGHRLGLLGLHRRARPGGRGRLRAERWTSSSPTRILGPLGMTDTRWWVDEAGRRPGWPPCTSAHPRPAGRPRYDAMGRCAPQQARRCLRRGRPGLARPPTTTGSCRCCCAAASSTACACSAPRTVR